MRILFLVCEGEETEEHNFEMCSNKDGVPNKLPVGQNAPKCEPGGGGGDEECKKRRPGRESLLLFFFFLWRSSGAAVVLLHGDLVI